MYWSVVAALQLAACVLALNPPFLDCDSPYSQYPSYRQCCTHDELPNGCECFDIVNNTDFTNSLLFKPQCPDGLNISFYFYDRLHNTNAAGIQIKAGPNGNVLRTPFDSCRKTVIFVHGYPTPMLSPYVLAIKDELLAAEDMNLILVDWEAAQGAGVFHQAVANVRTVGAMLGKLVQDLHEKAGEALKDIHLMAFDMAAHAVGAAGKEVERLTGSKVGRISVMDPTGINFEGYGPNVALDSSDALFVDAIHTDGVPVLSLGAGTLQAVGHVDFLMNGGMAQPGCPGHPDTVLDGSMLLMPMYTAACSHYKATEYFKLSISQCRYKGVGADENVCPAGYRADPSCRGVYVVEVKNEAPYC